MRIKNLPGALWVRYLPQMLMAEAAVILRAVKTRRLAEVMRARLEVLQRLGTTLAKRRVIQSARVVSARELDALIARDWFTQRRHEKRLEAEVRLAQTS